MRCMVWSLQGYSSSSVRLAGDVTDRLALRRRLSEEMGSEVGGIRSGWDPKWVGSEVGGILGDGI